MSNYSKGRAFEYRAQKLLEAAGYQTTRAAGSKGVVDVVAYGCGPVRLISIKSNGVYVSAVEREALQRVKANTLAQVEIWRFMPRKRDPLIEVI